MNRCLLAAAMGSACLVFACGGTTATPRDQPPRPPRLAARHRGPAPVTPPTPAPYERHALRGDELCNPNLYEIGDDDPPMMLCWHRASPPDGARPAASLDHFGAGLFVEPESAGSPVTLLGDHGACTTTTNGRAFVYMTDGTFEGFTLGTAPCGASADDVTVVLAGSHADARIEYISGLRRVARGARALALLRRSHLSLAAGARRPDNARAASIEGTNVRVVTATWITPADPDQGLDDEHRESFVSVWRGDRSAVVGVAWGDSIRLMRVGDRTFLVFTGAGGSVHHAMTYFFELMPEELTLRLTECEGVPADFDDPSCGIPNPSAPPDYAHLPFAPGTAEQAITEHPMDE